MVERIPLSNPLHGGLRADPFYPSVEVGADEECNVDELFAGKTEGVEILIEVQDLRRHGPRASLARKELRRFDRKETHEPRRAEEERVIVFRSRSPGVAALGEERSLGFALARGLDPRDPEKRE